jgi:hypothetical protein
MTFSVRDQSSHTDNRNLHLARTINGMAQQALTRAALTEIITNRNLYYEQRQHMPLEDVVEQMRAKDIRISNVVGFDTGGQRTPAFQVSFAAPDGGTAQLVTRDIAQRLTTAQRNVAPDARIEVLEIANLPVQPMSPARQNFAIAGLLAGLFLGALYVWYRSRRTLASPS